MWCHCHLVATPPPGPCTEDVRTQGHHPQGLLKTGDFLTGTGPQSPHSLSRECQQHVYAPTQKAEGLQVSRAAGLPRWASRCWSNSPFLLPVIWLLFTLPHGRRVEKHGRKSLQRVMKPCAPNAAAVWAPSPPAASHPPLAEAVHWVVSGMCPSTHQACWCSKGLSTWSWCE